MINESDKLTDCQTLLFDLDSALLSGVCVTGFAGEGPSEKEGGGGGGGGGGAAAAAAAPLWLLLFGWSSRLLKLLALRGEEPLKLY